MQITVDLLREISRQMVENNIEPFKVYIAIVDKRAFMVPISSLSGAPQPHEIIGTKFPVDTDINSHATAMSCASQIAHLLSYLDTIPSESDYHEIHNGLVKVIDQLRTVDRGK